MTIRPVIIIGAGGHAVVVADALLAAGHHVIGFTDSDTAVHGRVLCGLPVLGGDVVLDGHSSETLALANGIGGIGNPNMDVLRRNVQRRLQAQGWHFVTVHHPTAVVSPFARVGDGVQLLAASVVQPNARIGEGCIINTAAVVEHDVLIGAWTHVAPRALICGGVTVGDRCHIGAGAVVRQALILSDNTVVAAGAVVVTDCPEGGLLIGVPARTRKRSS